MTSICEDITQMHVVVENSAHRALTAKLYKPHEAGKAENLHGQTWNSMPELHLPERNAGWQTAMPSDHNTWKPVNDYARFKVYNSTTAHKDKPCDHHSQPDALRAQHQGQPKCQQALLQTPTALLLALAATGRHPASDTAHHLRCWGTVHHPWDPLQGVARPVRPHGPSELAQTEPVQKGVELSPLA